MLLKRLIVSVFLIISFSAFVAPYPAQAASAPYKIVKLTSPVRRGARAKLVIKTAVGTRCYLGYVTPSGRTSTAKGLGTKYADKKGLCTWNWLISRSTAPGVGHLYITVGGISQSVPIVIK